MGLFTENQVFPSGAVELLHPDNRTFKVNGHRLKEYNENDIIEGEDSLMLDTPS